MIVDSESRLRIDRDKEKVFGNWSSLDAKVSPIVYRNGI